MTDDEFNRRWAAALRHKRRKPRPVLPNGCRSLARERVSGAKRGIYDATVAGMDVDGRWAVVCEDHSSLCGAETLKDARAMSTREFCEDCMGLS